MRILIAFLIMGTWGWREGRIVSSICERRDEIEAGWFEGFFGGGRVWNRCLGGSRREMMLMFDS
jgi:hypothetical protein